MARRTVIAVIVVVHAGLLAWGGWSHSPTYDEVGHLPAGIHHLKYDDFELFRVNPPLVRMVAAAPVLAVGAETDWSKLENRRLLRNRARPDFEVGADFVEANGSRAFWLFTLARWACIPFSLLGALVCYLWAGQLYGRRAAMLALVLWCFSPLVLGHGQLITPDVAAASTGVLAFYVFWIWLRSGDWSLAVAAGIALGIAQLTKTTWIVLFGLWPVLWGVQRMLQYRSSPVKPVRALLEAGQLAAALALALLLINLGYGFNGSFQRLDTFEFRSASLAGETGQLDNRFAGSLLGKLPVPVPDQYLLGLDFQKHNFERSTQSYLRGELRDHGWWYYYLYAVGVKEPVGVLGLLLLAVVMRVRALSFGWRGQMAGVQRQLCVLVPLFLLLILVSSQTGINKHLRYLLPAYPFAFIWISQVAGWSLPSIRVCVGFFATWLVASSLWIYPHSMSYFNELAGGPRNGHAHLINSNIDWGQDLFFLKRLLQRRGIDHLGLVFWSRYDPRLAGLQFELPPSGPIEGRQPGQPRSETAPQPGIYAISVNHLRGYAFVAADGSGDTTNTRQHAYSYFQQFQPVASAGYSIYLYEISKAEALRVRRSLGMSEQTPAVSLQHTIDDHGVSWFAQFAPSGDSFATGAPDGTVHIWDGAGRLLYSLQGHQGQVNCGVFLGERLVTGSRDGTVRLWDLSDRDQLLKLEQHTAAVESMAVSADKRLLATGDEEGVVLLWCTDSWRVVRRLDHTLPATAVDIGADGTLVVGTGNWRTGQRGHVWLYRQGESPAERLEESHHFIVDLALDPSGTKVAARTSDHEIGIWNLVTGQLQWRLLSGRANRPLQFSRDGTMLASGDSSGFLMLWEMRAGNLILNMKGHEDRVHDISINSRGDRLLTVGNDGTVKLWNLERAP